MSTEFRKLDLRSPVAGIGPITVDSLAQNRRVGRTLMQAVMDHAMAQGKPSIRLLQATYNNGSLCLYTTLGFQTKAPLSVMQGSPLNLHFPGYDVRRATMADLVACNRICHAVHGFDRGEELRDAIAASAATVVEHLGRITGYTTGIAFFAHSVGETNQDLKALEPIPVMLQHILRERRSWRRIRRTTVARTVRCGGAVPLRCARRTCAGMP